MKTINILDSNTIDKIAAGEVVERPVSVAKELIENSIDASATAITIEIKDGGMSYLRITDNGEGIDRSQVKTAFLRHATSKIKSIEDLIAVSTLGFRGEALSSISSVAKVELLTKTKSDLFGTRYVIEGSKECVFEDAGVPDGTTIIVRDLFYNIPARRKFLKSSATEGGYIEELVEHLILSHPSVAFKLINNGKTKLQSTGSSDYLECIHSIYGKDISSNLIKIDDDNGDVHIHGYIGKPELSRGTRNLEIYFVNNRFIKSTLIEKALDEGYRNFLMLHKYPVVFLYFDIDSILLDVNVHPTKKEIRFLEGESLYSFISETIKNALSKKELIWEVSNSKNDTAVIPDKDIMPEPFEVKSFSQNKGAFLFEDDYDKADLEKDDYDKADLVKENSSAYTVQSEIIDHKICDDCSTESSLLPNEEVNVQLSLFEEDFLTEEAIKKHRIIGQLFNTYWLIEYDNKLFIVDQHAAHEKINYERLIKKIRHNEVVSQNLLPPIVVTLTSKEEEYVKKNIERFVDVGFNIEPFGGREYTISSVPMELMSLDPKDYFHEMLDELMEDREFKETDSVNLRIATMACKMSVKGGMELSYDEADKLISELLSLDNPYNCPHGRPTIVSYSKYEIEKMFKRIV